MGSALVVLAHHRPAAAQLTRPPAGRSDVLG